MAILDRAVYATQPRPLAQQITEYLKTAPTAAVDGEIFALIVPDTNRLSGSSVAAQMFKLLEGQHFDTVVLIAPSHNGTFGRINVCSVDVYRTPLGEVMINDALRHELCDEDDDIYLDDSGHFHPAGIDAQLPFLQTVLDDFDILPIVMGEESQAFCHELGHAIGEISYNRRTLVVASANVHSAENGALAALRTAFEAGDIEALNTLFNSERVQVEGQGALLVALIAARYRHADRAHVLVLEPPQDDEPGYVGAVLCRA